MTTPQEKNRISDLHVKYVDENRWFFFIYAPLPYYNAKAEMFIPVCRFLSPDQENKIDILYETYKNLKKIQ